MVPTFQILIEAVDTKPNEVYRVPESPELNDPNKQRG